MEGNLEGFDMLIQNEYNSKNKLSKLKLLGIIFSIIFVIAVIIIFSVIFLGKNEQNKQNDKTKDGEDLDFTEEEHKALSRKYATDGMVLAQNNCLPIEETDKVVLFGFGTKYTIYGGGGAAEIYKKGTSENIVPISILEGMKTKSKMGKFIYEENTKGYDVLDGLEEKDIENFAKKGSAKRTVAVMSISRSSSEGHDRMQDFGEYGTLLRGREIATYQILIKYFDQVVVILNVPSVMEINEFINDKTSILIAFLPGMEAGNAIADVLVGDENPNGRLSDTWAKKIDDYPTTKTFKANKEYVQYKETIFVGYRYFEFDKDKQSKVLFPFGFGLSYTTFKVSSSCSFNSENEIFTCVSKVTNTGKRKGKEVVQVYVQKQQNENFIKATRELVAFNKTKELSPGKSQEISMKFNLKDLASYDETGITGNIACYVLEAGDYKIYVGTNVAETRNESSLIFTYHQEKTTITEKLSNKLKPQDPEVADANKLPDFDSFMNENVEQTEEPNKYLEKLTVFEENQIYENNLNYEPGEIPTDQLNENNFIKFLQGNCTLEEIVNSMSDRELAFLTYGHGGKVRKGTGSIGGNYNAGELRKFAIPSADTNDGSAGLRHSEVFLGSTAWPCSTLLACTFNVDLMEKVGEETGKEARKIKSTIWLAPGMNIHRNPLCGRNFEYYSEDPVLTGKIVAALTRGVQSKRILTTLKHFAFNNKEENRMNSDSRLAERVAREIYLKGFEIAVKESHPLSIMAAHNKVNSIHSSVNFDLLTGILRDEWKYEGLVMTDWSTEEAIKDELKAGTNIKMPGGNRNDVLNALNSGVLTKENLTKTAYYILNAISKTAAVDPLVKKDPIDITKGAHIKLYDYLFNKIIGIGISYEECQDTDKGYNLINTMTYTWVTIYVKNTLSGNRNARIRYTGMLPGFGVKIKKYGDTLGEISDLEETGGEQNWKTSPDFTVNIPEGEFEITLLFTGEYSSSADNYKGKINWIELDPVI